MIADFLQMLQGTVFELLAQILGVLPEMPIDVSSLDAYLTDNILYKVLQWLNWFLPLDAATAMVSLWAAAMMVYIGMKLAIKYSGR